MDEDKPLLIDLYFGGERSKGFALFRNTQVAFGFPEVASELVRDIFEFFDLFLFLFIILARNIDCKSILQKTSKQFGLVLQKYERKSTYKSNFQCVSLRGRVCLCRAICFSKVRFSLAFYRRNLDFPPRYIAWNSFHIMENPHSLLCRLNFRR